MSDNIDVVRPSKAQSSPPVGTVRSGGRSAKVRAAIVTAVLDQLGRNGLAGITVDAVAAAAGVHRTTVYRRWPDRADLLRDALADGLETAVPVPDTGDIDTDLATLACDVTAVLSDPVGAAVLRAIAAAVPPDDLSSVLDDYWARRLSKVEARISSAVAQGQLPPDVDSSRAVQFLAAPLFFQLLIHRRLPDDKAAIAAARDALVLLRHRP